MSNPKKRGFNPAGMFQKARSQFVQRQPRPYLSQTLNVKTCDGQVTFVFLKEPAQRLGAISYELRTAYADVYGRLDKPLSMIIDGFIICMGTTYDIQFNLDKGSSESLFNFRDWWNGIRYASYASGFDSYITGIVMDVNNLWIAARINAITGAPIDPAIYYSLLPNQAPKDMHS